MMSYPLVRAVGTPSAIGALVDALLSGLPTGWRCAEKKGDGAWVLAGTDGTAQGVLLSLHRGPQRDGIDHLVTPILQWADTQKTVQNVEAEPFLESFAAALQSLADAGRLDVSIETVPTHTTIADYTKAPAVKAALDAFTYDARRVDEAPISPADSDGLMRLAQACYEHKAWIPGRALLEHLAALGFGPQRRVRVNQKFREHYSALQMRDL